MDPSTLPSILKKILESKKERLKHARSRRSLEELKAGIRDLSRPRGFRDAVMGHDSIHIIAEMKRRSPSKGLLANSYDIPALRKAYEGGGADAFSILTEEDHFGGSLEHLETLRDLTEKPILRKDFIFDEYQIYESRLAGADAVLLIAVLLDKSRIEDLVGLAGQHGLNALVEIHTAEELEWVLDTDADLLGINNRNLHTFDVSLETSVTLARRIPEDLTKVGESGIHSRKDIERLTAAGITAFLVGEHLVKSLDPASAIRQLKGQAP